MTYTMYGQDIGDEKVVFYSSQKSFSKSGSYFLRYVESSETKTLINDNGFERTVRFITCWMIRLISMKDMKIGTKLRRRNSRKKIN